MSGNRVRVETPRGIVITSIFKSPVAGRVAVRKNHNHPRATGKRDLRVHGGPNKAIYAYSSEHYTYWTKQLPDADLVFGNFGENLTITGLTEEQALLATSIGSNVHSARNTATHACFKLALRFGRADMIKLFWQERAVGRLFCNRERRRV